MLACVVLLAPLLAVARGFGSGAPSMACTGMTPQHSPHSWQTVAAPFQLTTDSHTYTPGAPLRVTISGSRGFKGFMLQARSPFATGSNPVGAVGTFQDLPASARTENCFSADDTATHVTGHDVKDSVTVTWVPPANLHGPVALTATIVAEFSTFWVGVTTTVHQGANHLITG
ncbi:putative defense protein Hdd11 [Branchiostoma floridae x Branchiostoma belcheri]